MIRIADQLLITFAINPGNFPSPRRKYAQSSVYGILPPSTFLLSASAF